MSEQVQGGREFQLVRGGDVETQEMPDQTFGHTGLRQPNVQLVEKVEQLAQANLARSRLLANLVKAEELERARIASAVHDDSIQVMAAVALQLEMLGDDLGGSDHGAAVGEAAGKVRSALGRLRRLIFDLSPRSLETGGLGPAIETYLREAGAEAGFAWTVGDRLRSHLPDEVDAILYRVAHEAIRNIQKHARARTVTVVLSERNRGTLLTIADDGVGFSAGTDTESRPGHIGLASMRERAELAGGTLRVEASPGAGCVVEVWLPHSASSSGDGHEAAS
jgi:signal transduction histidine kinase